MAEIGHSKLRRVICAVGVVVGFCPLVAGRTICVASGGSADHRTIQAAIDAASNGDTVLVAPGTYTGDGNWDIDFKGKGITLESDQGPESCIIDCGGPYPAYVYWPGRRGGSGRRGDDPKPHDYHRAFYFHSHQAANSLVQGFTVTGGVAMDTAGKLDNGGAFHCTDSRLTIRNCIIISNAASRGGGIYARDSHIQIDNCVITENKAHEDLPSRDTGGGAWIFGGEVCFSNCRVTGNVASGGGGGISCQGSHRFVNCTIAGNRSNPYGKGGGILFGPGREQDTYYVLNSIVWGNMVHVTADGFVADDVAVKSGGILGGMGVNAVYSLIGADSNSVDNDVTGQWLTGDPLFADPGRWDPNELASAPLDDFWVEGDYHLKSQTGRWDPNSRMWVKDGVTSPCIDAGDPNSPVGGEPAPNGGRINMGAYGGTAEASKSPLGLSGKYGGGYGTMGNPYLIFTAEQFDAIGAEPADWDKHFKLMADIDLSGYPGHELHLLGIDDTSPFSGVFDGDGHAIFGLGRNSTQEYTSGALFGCLTGTVKGVGLIDPNVGGRLLYYTGALVGDNHGTVSNCYAHDVNVVGAGWYAGGLVGRNLGAIIDCNSTGVVRDRSAGGLVGRNGGTITGCRSAAIVVADTIAGGLVGSNVSGTIINSCSTGTVTGDDRTGGLVGNNYEGTITCCYSAAEVVGNDGVGGLVGENWQGLVTNCYSAANVQGDRLTGGLVGDSGGGAITNCYATGPTTGRWPVGGITHWRHDDDVVTGCFWDMETTGCSLSAAGTGKTTAQMQTAAAFLAAGWDFTGETANGAEDVWQIAEGQDYPRLFWETKSK